MEDGRVFGELETIAFVNEVRYRLEISAHDVMEPHTLIRCSGTQCHHQRWWDRTCLEGRAIGPPLENGVEEPDLHLLVQWQGLTELCNLFWYGHQWASFTYVIGVGNDIIGMIMPPAPPAGIHGANHSGLNEATTDICVGSRCRGVCSGT